MADLQNVTWADFKIGDLFDIERGKEKAPKQTPDGTVPLIIETSYNNGFNKNCKPTKIFKGNCISISINFAQNVFYQPVDLGASVNIALLYHKDNKLTRGSGLFISTLLRKNNAKYDYSMKISNDRIKETIISLPVQANGDPDYDFMEEFIKELETEQFTELDIYLQSTGLSDTKLTKSEQKALNDFDSLTWGQFMIGDLFDIQRGKEKAPKQTPDGTVPLIIETSYNNGFNKNCKPTKIFKGNCISISINFAQNVFYQPVDLGASVNIALLYHKDNKLTRGSGLFIASLLRKLNSKYDYSMKISNDKIKDTMIDLPILKNGDINYKYMETYIKSIEKLTIKDVVDLKDEQLATTKQVV